MSSHSDDSSSAKPPRRLRPPTDDLPQIVGRAIETLNIGKAVAAARLELFRAPTAVRPMLASIRPRLLQLPAIAFPGPQEMIRASEILAKAGWFFDPDTPIGDFRDAAAGIGRGDGAAADRLMSDHFERRSEEIEARLLESFPERSQVLSPAFGAHRRGEYALSVLAFLSQADGLSAKLRGGYFFLRKQGPKGAGKRKRQTANYVLLRDKGGFDRVHLAALEIELPIAANQGERAAGDGAFNRHAVLHGESSDYGTRINSLQSMSLLNYVAFGAETRERSQAGAD